MADSTFDPVQRPAHYASGGIECADAITAALHAETDPVVGWCIGNAIKYLWRQGQKDDAVQDLRKAIWYIERAIARRRAYAGRAEAIAHAAIAKQFLHPTEGRPHA